jgi:hypothetical protein
MPSVPVYSHYDTQRMPSLSTYTTTYSYISTRLLNRMRTDREVRFVLKFLDSLFWCRYDLLVEMCTVDSYSVRRSRAQDPLTGYRRPQTTRLFVDLSDTVPRLVCSAREVYLGTTCECRNNSTGRSSMVKPGPKSLARLLEASSARLHFFLRPQHLTEKRFICDSIKLLSSISTWYAISESTCC